MEYHHISDALKRHGYIIERPLGKGGFASCWRCTRTQGGFEFACKVISYKSKNSVSIEALQNSYENELSTLKMAYHPNIIYIYDSFIDGDSFFIILEFCPFGTVCDEIKQAEGGKLSIEHLQKYTSQLINAVSLLHSLGIAHNDIKPNNCLIDKDGNLKLSDFGMAMHDISQTNIKQGTMQYMAPELFASGVHDPFATDIWALGVTIYYFWKGKNPFTHAVTSYQLLTEQKCFVKIHQRSKNPLKCKVAKIINHALKIDATSRANIMQIAKIFFSYEKAHFPIMRRLEDSNKKKLHRSTAEIPKLNKLPRLQNPYSRNKSPSSNEYSDTFVPSARLRARRNSDDCSLKNCTQSKDWLPHAMRNPPIQTLDFHKNRASLKLMRPSF